MKKRPSAALPGIEISRYVPRSPSGGPATPRRGRSRSADSFTPRRSASRGRRGRGSSNIRYDRDGACALTANAKVHEQEAWQKLQEHNARAWKRRIDWMVLFQKNTITKMRRLFSNAEEPPQDENEHETLLGIPSRPGLLTIFINDLHLVIDKPSFHLHDLPKFMHDIGKGIPYSMQYSLLIPLSLSLDMGEARVLLRDYPSELVAHSCSSPWPTSPIAELVFTDRLRDCRRVQGRRIYTSCES